MPARDTTLDLFATATSPAVGSTVTRPAPPRSQPPTLRAHRRAQELWLAMSLPSLSLEALDVGQRRARGAVAIVDPADDARVVVACNAPAAHAGVVPGLGLNAAFALVHDLDVLARDVVKEQALLDRLATGAGAFTPRVSLVEPDVLLLEVRGSLKLFGGVQALGDRLQRWLEGVGVTAMLALAPTPLAALWLARAQGGTMPLPVATQIAELPARLAKLPLNCLRWPERVCQALQTMGVATVGDCLRLPRDGFARRFGPALLDDLDRALGRSPDVRRIHVPRERYLESLEFEHEIEDVPRLARSLEPLLIAMGDFLRQRQCCLRGFELQLRHRRLPATRIAIKLVVPAADAAHFVELLNARLERIVLPAPVHRVRLRSSVLVPIDAALVAMAADTGALAAELNATDLMQGPSGRPAAGRRTAQMRVPRLVERLRARLGAEAVHGVCLVPEHRPESASRAAEPRMSRGRWVRGRHESPDRSPVGDGQGTRTPRPLWLLSEPQSLVEERGWPCYEGRLELDEGPERIESGWWDGRDVARDYYVARSATGLRLWIYRERRAGRHWFVHGVFA